MLLLVQMLSNDNIAVKLTSKNMKLQSLHQDFVVKNAKSFGIVSGGNLDLDINLSGSGKTYRQLVNNLNGKVIAIAGESVIQTGKLDFLAGNFITQLLNTLNLSSDKVRNIDMTCAVVRADVGGGKAVFPKGIALNAKQLNLVSDGSINLVNDKIDFGIRPFSGKVVDTNLAQALSSFIKVKGTLSDPKIALDDAQAVQALIGVAATGRVRLIWGLSWLWMLTVRLVIQLWPVRRIKAVSRHHPRLLRQRRICIRVHKKPLMTAFRILKAQLKISWAF